MLVIVARCLQTQSILKQWSTIEKSPFSVTSPSFIQYESRLSRFHACMNVSCDLCFSQSQWRIAYFHANGKYYIYIYVYSSLIHWYMACPNRYDTVRIAQTCRAYAGRV